MYKQAYKIFILTVILLLSISTGASAINKKDPAKELLVTKTITKPVVAVVPVKPWWLGDLITVVGILVGALMIVWQLNRQHKNELKIQKDNFREQLRLEIYQEFSIILEEVANKVTDAGGYAHIIPVNLRINNDLINSGINASPLNSRAIDYSHKHGEAMFSIVKLIRLFEKYEIISPELGIFKMAINVASYDIGEISGPLHTILLRVLPMEIPDDRGNIHLGNVVIPTQEQISQVDALAGKYKDAVDDLGGYLYDLNIELQGIFLGGLFDNKTKKRAPIDTEVKVITTNPDDMSVLKKYFEEETAWGKNAKEVEKQVRDALSNST